MARKTLKEQKAAKALKTAEQTALKNETAASATVSTASPTSLPKRNATGRK